jgi:hypothetical protein
VRGGIITTIMLASLLVGTASAGAGSRQAAATLDSMTVTASPQTASAHGVRLAVTLRYQMQCNYPGAGALVITFPKALKPPKKLAAGSVRMAGKPIAAEVDGRQVTVTIPAPTGTLCGIVGPGLLKLAFTPKAHLSNPSRPGSYRFAATHTSHTFAAKLAIKAAS